MWNLRKVSPLHICLYAEHFLRQETIEYKSKRSKDGFQKGDCIFYFIFLIFIPQVNLLIYFILQSDTALCMFTLIFSLWCIISVITWIQAYCLILGMEVIVFTKLSCFKFSPGSYSLFSVSESLPTSKKKTSLLLLGNWYFFHHVDSFNFFWTKRLVWFILYDWK